MMKRTATLSVALLVGASATAQQPGDAGASALDWIQVTATRFSDPVQEVPNAISIISGDELRARGVPELDKKHKGPFARHSKSTGQSATCNGSRP